MGGRPKLRLLNFTVVKVAVLAAADKDLSGWFRKHNWGAYRRGGTIRLCAVAL